MNVAPDKKTLILSAATELFSHYGYAKTSMDEIAHLAQIGKATIYYYFPCKEDVFFEAVLAKGEEYFQILNENIACESSFEAKLSTFLHLPVHYVLVNMPILAESMRELPMVYKERLETLHRDYHRRMNQVLHGIMEFGIQEGIVNQEIDALRFSEVINDWFLLGDSNITINDKERLLEKIDRDHELIIKLIMYGIIKRS